MNINDIKFIEEEVNRINALPAQGKQSTMVQVDMKKWAQKEGMWPQINYHRIIEAHAEARGWTQEGFNEMEVFFEKNTFNG